MVAAVTFPSIEAVLTRLRNELGSELLLGPVLTRVTLRTGVDTRKPRPDQAHNVDAIKNVVGALNDMGYLR